MPSSGRPRILLLAHRPLSEASTGGGQRTSHIRRAAADLAELDTLVITNDEACRASEWNVDRVKLVTYRRSGRLIARMVDHLRVRRWVRELLSASDYDIVIARYLSTAMNVPTRFRGRVVLDADDIIKSPDRTTAFTTLVAQMARAAMMRLLLRQVRHVWFVNPRDRELLGSRVRSHSLLPNAAIVHRAGAGPRVRDTLMIVGNHAHLPNREGVEFFLYSVLPELRHRRPSVRLRIIGSVPESRSRRWSEIPNVDVLGYVQDLGDEYARASIAIAPVNTGGGTQIKVIEGLANGCPVVASRFAYAGFSRVLHAGKHLYVADSAQEWVEACIEALDNPRRSERMARGASERVRSEYGVDTLQENVRRTLAPLLVERRGRHDQDMYAPARRGSRLGRR